MPKNSATKLKIGFVLDDGLDKPDGVQQYILLLGEWLKARGHNIDYLVGETKRTDISGVKVLSKNIGVNFNGNRLSSPVFASAKKIKNILKTANYDVLHIQMPYSPLMAARVINKAYKTTPIVATFHILPLSYWHKLGNKFLSVMLYFSKKKITKYISVSEPAREFARNVYRVDSEVIGNAVYLPNIKRHTDKNKFKIVFLGRLVPRKGCDSLLKAISLLDEKEKSNIEVRIGGRGEQLNNLKKYVSQNNLKSIVKFYGFIPEENKIKFLNNADLAVFPAYGGESFGIVLLEAMSARGPVVLAGNNPGYASVMIEDKANLFNPKNPMELKNIISAYIKDGAALQKSYKKQRSIVSKYDIELIGQKIENIYYQLTNVDK